MILRFMSVIQLCSIFPILFYVVRIQFFGTFYKDNYPSRLHVIIFGVVLLLISWVVLYFCYDILGKMISIIGALTGLFLIFIIPLIVNIIYYNERHPYLKKNRADTEHLIDGEESGSDESRTSFQNNSNTNNSQKNTKDSTGKITLAQMGIQPTTKPDSPKKNFFFYCSQYALMAFGVFVLIIQFVPINFFNITIQ
jgi:hypothetical protein